MKYRIVICLMLFSAVMLAQVDFGLKVGVNTFGTNNNSNSVTIVDPADNQNYSFSVRETQFGFHAGIFTRFNVKKFFIQPELIYSTDNVDFSLKDANDVSVLNSVGNESYQNIDIPILLGFQLGKAFRVLGGPVGHLFLDSVSDLTNEDYYDSIHEKFDLGWQAGLSFDVWKLTLDLRYEGNFNKFGDHLILFGEEIAFSNNENRILASLGFRF